VLRALQRRVAEANYVAQNAGNPPVELCHYSFAITPIKAKTFYSVRVDDWTYETSAAVRAEYDYLSTAYQSAALEPVTVEEKELVPVGVESVELDGKELGI
jgi:hypothetical protein